MEEHLTPGKPVAVETAYVQLLREWIAAGEPAWLPLRGESMTRFLPNGSRVLVSRVTTRQIAHGDLLVYEAEGRLICHRVLRRRARDRRRLFLTKGDGWRTIESWIGEEQVLGRVTRVERNGEDSALDTPIRRLRARGIAVLSLVVIASRAILRWGKQHARIWWRWARTS